VPTGWRASVRESRSRWRTIQKQPTRLDDRNCQRQGEIKLEPYLTYILRLLVNLVHGRSPRSPAGSGMLACSRRNQFFFGPCQARQRLLPQKSKSISICLSLSAKLDSPSSGAVLASGARPVEGKIELQLTLTSRRASSGLLQKRRLPLSTAASSREDPWHSAIWNVI
jgi:hypothetical protein